MKQRALAYQTGWTLAEMMVSVLCFALAGGAIFLLLNSGMILYAKNMSVNTGHEDTRRSINRLLRDIHASVSVPQLIDGFNADGSLQVHSGTTSAAGVAFQLVSQGPNYVWQDPNSQILIMIYDGGSKPTAGQRLIIPLFGIEADITKSTAALSSGHSNIFLTDAAGNVVDQTTVRGKSPAGQAKSSNSSTSGGSSVYAITYYTERVAYIVQNSQLKIYYRRYLGANSSGTGGTFTWVSPVPIDGDSTNMNPSNWRTTGVVVARDITSSTPFSPQWSTTAGVASISVTTGGSNYPSATTVTVAGGGGSGAAATASVSNGVITGVTVTNTGSGYTSAPTVTFTGGSGSGAAALASFTTTPTTDDRYVHVQITATDPTFSNRKLATTSSLVDSAIPYRSRLCSIQ
jgi:hypothetical protein